MIRVLDSADSTLVEWGRQQQHVHTERRKISLLIDKVRKQLVEKVIKLVDSEKDVHTERRKIRLLIDKNQETVGRKGN